MNTDALKKTILRTLVYFDIFSLPLKGEELFNFLWRPPALNKNEFFSGLEILVGQGKVGRQDGYYFLPNKESIVSDHLIKKEICAKKMKRAKRAARLLSFVPFLNAIFLCNSVAAGTATEKSDIDFLIVVTPGRLWLVRAIVNFLLRLTGKRTYGKKLANRICLSFFVDEKSLDFSNLRSTEEDIHFAYWTHQTVPLFDPYYLWREFIKANQWTVRYLPHVRDNKWTPPLVMLGNGKRIWRRTWEKFWTGWYGDLLERQADGLGRQGMKLSLKGKAELNDKGVVLSKKVIKLHEDDKRLAVREEWVKRLDAEKQQAFAICEA